MSLASVRADFGDTLTASAEGFIVAGFGAVLIGYALSEALGGSPRSINPVPRGSRARRRERTVLYGFSTVIVVYVLCAISPGDLMILRSERTDTAVQGQIFVAVVATMIVQAGLMARAAMETPRSMRLLYPAAATALSVAVLYAVGTRYFLGFLACTALYFVAKLYRPFSVRRLTGVALVVVALAAAQGTMRILRGTGIEGADASHVAAALARAETYVSSEGMLRVHAWVHHKKVFESGGRLPEHGFLLYWWVPRAWWPDKPTMDGYWIAHDVMADENVSMAHNVAGGFSLPALLDFGPRLALLMCVLYGIGLRWADRFMLRRGDPRDPASVLVAILPFALFFAMRSPQTSALFLESCVVVYVPAFWWISRGRPSRRIVRRASTAAHCRPRGAGSVPAADVVVRERMVVCL